MVTSIWRVWPVGLLQRSDDAMNPVVERVDLTPQNHFSYGLTQRFTCTFQSSERLPSRNRKSSLILSIHTLIIPQSITSTPHHAWWRTWVIKEWSTDRNENYTRVLGTYLELDWGVVDLFPVPFCFDFKIVFLGKEEKRKEQKQVSLDGASYLNILMPDLIAW